MPEAIPPRNDEQWPHRRPPYYTEVHGLVLHQFWKEGMTPTPMMMELGKYMPDLTPVQCREIVCYWMWSENLRIR